MEGMGAGLFDQFKDMTEQADSVLGYSIEELCIKNPNKQLSQTQFTQPALYVVNALSYMKRLYDAGQMPDYVAGHSLGEYNALFAAGVFDFSSGLRLVQKRGELMAQVTGGGMAAVIGPSSDKVEQIISSSGIEGVSIANYNAPIQTVISGSRASIEKLESIFTEAGAAYIVLNVSGAFHSQWMSAAQKEFSAFIESFDFHVPAMPVISNLSAEPYTASSVKENLLRQICSPVRWTEIIGYLLSVGEAEIVEIGPGEVLTGLNLKIRQKRIL
ncbi:MAG: ACP S-malonyltransferase [Ectothiorhodospiraceae bacterium]|nr:ACP S-malonyltransferase [Ectothiorhodospiraceae bacterium]